jgi:hypothetical protein
MARHGAILGIAAIGASLALGLPTPAHAAVTFLGDWADFGTLFQMNGPQTTMLNGQPVGWVAGYGANHWRIVQEKGLDRLRPIVDPTSPKGGSVLQVEVRPGDNVGYTGERAEVSVMLAPDGSRYPVTGESGHEYYALSIKLDPDWQPPSAGAGWVWGLFIQLHGPDDFSAPPAFAMAAEKDFHVNLCSGDLIEGGALRRNKDATSVPLSRGDLRPGHWVEFVLDVTWAYDNRGSLDIFRRDEGEKSFVKVLSLDGQPTLQFRSSTPDVHGTHYWKVGYYRSISPGVTNRLWLGPLARGSSFQEVAVAAFGQP